MATFNGHKNWNHWNVSLWINNDEALYELAKDCIERNRHCQSFSCSMSPREKAAHDMLDRLSIIHDVTHTPDGAPYSVTTIRAAMRGM
jgi:hypothetical protein